jgi:hypothetical protein
MCLQKLGPGEEASHDEVVSRDEVEANGQRGTCRREEAIEREGSVDDMCWRTCRPCLACQWLIICVASLASEACVSGAAETLFGKTNLRSRSLSLSRSLSIAAT